jgi:hypothetical protein
MFIDPWDYKNNFGLSEGENKIKGPSDIDSNRHLLKFYYKIESDCKVLYTKNKTNDYNNLQIKFLEKEAIIENISKSDIYRGSEFLLLGLQIIYRLKYKKCSLEDLTYFVCDRKFNFFSNSNILQRIPGGLAPEVETLDTAEPIGSALAGACERLQEKKQQILSKLIYLFRFGNTFYMSFDFKPKITLEEYNKLEEINENNNNNLQANNINANANANENVNVNINTNLKDITPVIMKLLKSLFTISWTDVDDYLNIIKNFIKNDYYKNSEKLFNFRILQYFKWKNYWNNIIKSWKKFYKKYKSVSTSPFQAFIKFNYEECDIFINWLELYSFSIDSSITYSSTIFNNNIDIEKKISAGIDDFKKLKGLLDKCLWINNNVKMQPLETLYIKKF